MLAVVKIVVEIERGGCVEVVGSNLPSHILSHRVDIFESFLHNCRVRFR